MPVCKLLDSLPQSAYSATQVLEHEGEIAEKVGISLYRLMEKAGSSFFNHVRKMMPGLTNLLVVCGKGNNGGDGFVIARLAYEAGIKVTVYFCSEADELKGDALKAFEKLQKTNISVLYQSEMQLTPHFLSDNNFDLVVDALFGIGYQGDMAEPLATAVNVLNHVDIPVFSVDVPSGLEASTGHVPTTAVIADQTVTFIVAKQGLLSGQAAKHVGELFLSSLSLNDDFQYSILESAAIQGGEFIPKKPQRNEASHKGHIGLLLAIGSNQGLPGAIRLASESALRSGAALVAVSCHQDNQQLVLNGRPELMLAPDSADKLLDSPFFEKAKVLLIGPGLGQSPWSKALFDLVINSDKQLVLDADALQLLAQHPHKRDDWVLTPHPGEAARLLGCTVQEIESDRFAAINRIVEQYGGICVLKGAGSLIADANNLWINTSGNSGMATGGMGDVLSGIIAALMMQLDHAIDATRLAVFLHGKAADKVAKEKGKIGMLASDLYPYIQQLLNENEM